MLLKRYLEKRNSSPTPSGNYKANYNNIMLVYQQQSHNTICIPIQMLQYDIYYHDSAESALNFFQPNLVQQLFIKHCIL